MKKIICGVLVLLLLFVFVACNEASDDEPEKTPIEQLTNVETALFEALKTMSRDFFNPNEVRLLEIGDYEVVERQEWGSGRSYVVTARIQGENKLGGTLNHYYKIRIGAVSISPEDRKAAEKEFDDGIDWWEKYWDTCAENDYPRYFYSTFEEYREAIIWVTLKDKYNRPTTIATDDRTGLCKELTGSSASINTSEEEIFNVAKINKALKYYWDERLGN